MSPLAPCYLLLAEELAPCTSPAAALGRVGSVPHLGSTIEMVLDVKVTDEPAWGSLVWENRLLSNGTGEGEMSSSIPLSITMCVR